MRLIDADALKKYIHDQNGRPFIGITLGEAFQMMVDEQPTINPQKWIPCEEFMPLFDFTDVIVAFKNGDDCLYDIAYRVRGKWSYQSDMSDGDEEPFAWMPLTKPKEEDR